MNRFIISAAVFLILISSIALNAEERWSVEFRPGLAFATGDFSDADMGTGLNLEAAAAYRFMPHLGVYAGWGWTQFISDDSFAGEDMDFEETGYTLGLQFIHPIGTGRINYMARGGLVFNHIEIEDDEGDIVGDSDHSLGWQIEAGLGITMGDSWRFLPSVRYRAVPLEIEVGDATTDMDLTYISAGLGISRSF